uniref:NADH dehydrogenase subunit 6 n=1 Tax=Lamellodiscus spari TaxID=330065 RepID=A0A346Q028_9PLAT|nr:NADH dehydrogenase subunit 6 [Lamellodiscus spari]
MLNSIGLLLFICSSLGYFFIVNLIHYCILLIINALIVSLWIIFFTGQVWYSILFYMVYVGGVYILFIFLSVYSPNLNNLLSFNIFWFGGVFLFLLVVGASLTINNISNYFGDNSYYFCSFNEVYTYLFICSFLLIGFYFISYISSSKEYFIR